MTKQEMASVRDRDVRHYPIKDGGALRYSAYPRSQTPSSTASFITPIASNWPARACASDVPRREIGARAKAGSPNPRRDKAVENDGLRYGAMESALRPSLPTATRADPHEPKLLLILRRPKSMSA